MINILYLDDDLESVQYLQAVLPAGYEVHTARHVKELAGWVGTMRFDLLVLALDRIKSCRESVLDFLRESCGFVPLVLVTEGSPEVNYKAILASGAQEVLTKPFTRMAILKFLQLVETVPDLVYEAEPEDDDRLWGASPAMSRLRQSLQSLGACLDPVLILGETGVGKEVCARYLHEKGSRREGVFKALNCGAIPEHLIEAELFGVRTGAYTEARDRPGLIESAQQGTLLLDELADLPPQHQVKLLRFLEDGEVYRLGSAEPIFCNARILAATNKNLEVLMEKGLFREDLYYRLNTLVLRVPALRDHREDIPSYCGRFLEQYRSCNPGIQAQRFSLDALSWMQAQDWPGNVRQLRNAVRAAAVRTRCRVIDRSDLEPR